MHQTKHIQTSNYNQLNTRITYNPRPIHKLQIPTYTLYSAPKEPETTSPLQQPAWWSPCHVIKAKLCFPCLSLPASDLTMRAW